MCYFLYGAVNDGVNPEDYKKATRDCEFCFNLGNADAVNACVANLGDSYRITLNYCDCDTAIGGKHTNKKELQKLKELLLSFKNIRGIKYVLISKNWWKDTNTRQESVHMDDVDILHFLANMEDNCLYKIELYKRYY